MAFKTSQLGQKQIKPAEKPEEVTNYGLWHLGRRDHSVYELRKKLGRKTDNSEWIEQTINYLLGLGYLNDQRFVENYLKEYNQIKHYGPTRIKQEFRMKGIDNDLIKSAIAESEFDYFESALQYLNRKCQNPIEDRKEKDRITRNLLSKGFTFDMIRYAFEDHLKEQE